ncbi:MAG: ATP-dependent DNA ligase [Solirubrobacteraceae bacterium]
MSLPLTPVIEPQLARPRVELPAGEQWCYEPKFDGFRAIAFVDGGAVELQSRGGKSLTRYFPELQFPAGHYVLDGEIVIDGDDGEQDFDALGQRIHPAASRIAMLAETTPARYIAFDVLAREGEVLMMRPLRDRRAALEELARELVADPERSDDAGRSGSSVSLTPWTCDRDAAEPWLRRGEGVVAKDLDAPYRPGQRAGMVKVKLVRTIDAVIAGYRPGKEPETVGSLILGLYDEAGELHVIGHSSGLRAAEKRSLVQRLAAYATGERGRGGPSRWKNEKELEWIALRPELVVEVRFDHTSGGRIRHGTKILRWREDKPPRECLLSQMDR